MEVLLAQALQLAWGPPASPTARGLCRNASQKPVGMTLLRLRAARLHRHGAHPYGKQSTSSNGGGASSS
eukprot:scaffold17568_cov33-Tisochrysis_lutea.AAC.1